MCVCVCPHSHILSSTEIRKHLPLPSFPRDARLEGVRSFLPEPAVLIAHGGNISTWRRCMWITPKGGASMDEILALLGVVFRFSGWWLTYPSENVKVSWDDYSQLNGKIKNLPNHQPVWVFGFCFLPQLFVCWGILLESSKLVLTERPATPSLIFATKSVGWANHKVPSIRTTKNYPLVMTNIAMV